MSNPIRIKGVLYDSLSAACRAYGVMLQTVLLRMKRGETVEQADLAYAYGLDPCTVYRRYRTGLRGRDLVRPTRRKK